MRFVFAAAGLALFAMLAFGQVGNGTITGTVTDPAGAVVANATVQAKNAGSGLTYPVQTTGTGNYTIPQLPPGMYELTVSLPGFKKYSRQGLTVEVAQVLRIDIPLEVGNASEAVTVTAEASMLKTETGDISQNVNVQTLDQLPMLAIGAAASGSSGIRNPNNVLDVIPGVYYVPNSQVKINGAPTNSQSYHVEGQDATNQGIPYAAAETQPSVDAIQEVSVTTSNFAAEYGAAGGGFFNVTMRSGSNQYHGSGYDYLVNEVLNAGTPYTGYPYTSSVPGTPGLKPRARRNDYGFTIGGPVSIPKLYNGHDKTFFFFNFEQFRETQNINNIPVTVPTAAYRQGNFLGAEAALGFKQLGTDPLGRPIIANAIYNPTTARTVGGQLIEDPFPNNVIPASMFDPVAVKIQNLIPAATSGAPTFNYLPSYPSVRHTTIPGVKIDQQLGSKGHLSFYWSYTHTDSQYSPIYGQSEGYPTPITEARGTFIHSHIERLNYDYTISPTLLLHLGAGYQQNNFFDDAPVLDYNASQSLGLVGATVNRNFPQFTGFCPSFGPGLPVCSGAGGLENLGPIGQTHTFYEKPSANASITWVRGNHSYKLGGEAYYYSVPTIPYTATNGSYGFSANETALPYLVGSTGQQSLTGGTVGFPYASFLLGAVDSFNIAAPAEFRQYKQQWAIFLQDSWKITRKLTLEYGVRWDYGTYFSEQSGRAADFSPTTPNPTVGGIPGAFLFEGTGPGRCNCQFAHNYPFAIGPRLGVAYQVSPKTVIRAGWGLMYNQTGTTSLGYAAAGIATTHTVTSAGQGQPAMTLQNGVPSQFEPTWPVFSPGLFPTSVAGGQALPGGIGLLDQNAGRPARQDQWSVGIQQEITPNLVVEAAYVGNRGVWWQSPALQNINALTPAILAAHGLNIQNPANQALLTSPISSPAAIAAGFTAPYAGFSTRQSVAQSIRPFPQFGYIPIIGDPVGKTWYDALQAKVTKRYSHNLVFNAAFTYQKSMQEGVDTNTNATVGGPLNTQVGAIGNPGISKSISSLDQPLDFTISGSYSIPKLQGNKFVSWIVQDWQIGALMEYASGLPIPTPAATTNLANQLFQPTLAQRVPGQPLFNVSDINCQCYDPATTFVLNRAAWANPAQGFFSSGAPFYSDFRYARHPIENMNLGRTWRFRERFSLNLRVEFNNIFNRTYLNNPNAATPFAPVSVGKNGLNSGGFGYINLATSGTQFGQPRNGDIVMKVTF